MLDISGGSGQSGAWLSIDVSSQKSSQQWSLVSPQVFVPTWSYIQSGLTGGQNNPLVRPTLRQRQDIGLTRTLRLWFCVDGPFPLP